MNPINLQLNNLPGIVIISIGKNDDTLAFLDSELGINLDTDELINGLCNSVSDELTAVEDLDYYLLNLSNGINQLTYFPDRYNFLIDEIRKTGIDIFKQLLVHKLYFQNKLPYRSIEVRPNYLKLIRVDLFIEQLKTELNGYSKIT